jgi:hypothetical protein
MKKCSGHLDRRTGGLGWQKTGQSVTPPGVRQVLRGCELCDHDGAEPLGRQGGVLTVGSIDRFRRCRRCCGSPGSPARTGAW